MSDHDIERLWPLGLDDRGHMARFAPRVFLVGLGLAGVVPAVVVGCSSASTLEETVDASVTPTPTSTTPTPTSTTPTIDSGPAIDGALEDGARDGGSDVTSEAAVDGGGEAGDDGGGDAGDDGGMPPVCDQPTGTAADPTPVWTATEPAGGVGTILSTVETPDCTFEVKVATTQQLWILKRDTDPGSCLEPKGSVLVTTGSNGTFGIIERHPTEKFLVLAWSTSTLTRRSGVVEQRDWMTGRKIHIGNLGKPTGAVSMVSATKIEVNMCDVVVHWNGTTPEAPPPSTGKVYTLWEHFLAPQAQPATNATTVMYE